jgi:Fur family transcriptional regulator, ferric uptake regulator
LIIIINTEGAVRQRVLREGEVLESYLRGQGQKMTLPRLTVLKAFLGVESHVTAEELLAVSRRLNPRIGQATVFRTVKLLADAGIARETGTAGGGKSYEHAFGHAHHDHLVCIRCGKVVEFQDDGLERIQERVYRRHGYEPIGHRLELQGLCPSCDRPGTAVKAVRPGGARHSTAVKAARPGGKGDDP